MTKQQKQSYEGVETLQEILKQSLAGRRFALSCGHHVSISHQFSNDLVIKGNGKNRPFTLICADCAG